MKARRSDGLHAISGPYGVEGMGFEDRTQQAPAIDGVIDDKNRGVHEGYTLDEPTTLLAPWPAISTRFMVMYRNCIAFRTFVIVMVHISV